VNFKIPNFSSSIIKYVYVLNPRYFLVAVLRERSQFRSKGRCFQVWEMAGAKSHQNNEIHAVRRGS